jgi:transposase
MDAIEILNREGWNDSQIGTALGSSSKAIRAMRKRRGIASVDTKYAPKIDHSKAFELYREGWSDGQIARHFGAHQTGVWRWRERHGLPPNVEQSPRMGKEDKRKIDKLLGRGMSARKACKRSGFSRGSIMRRSRKRKLEGRRATGITDRVLLKKIEDTTAIMSRIQSALGVKLPADILEQASQEMYCDLIDCALDADLIERRAASYRNEAFAMCGSKYGAVRLDEPDENGLTLLDTLTNDQWDPETGW